MDSLAIYGSSGEEGLDVELSESQKRKRSQLSSQPCKKRYFYLCPPRISLSDLYAISINDWLKRKLPSLSPSLTPPVPESQPSKHQGRIRTHPHVEGQFASYVYVSVSLERGAVGGIGKLVNRAMKHARNIVPSINPIAEAQATCNNEDDDPQELHVSLSRPVYLRHHQREDFKKAVKTIASSNVPLEYFPRILTKHSSLLISCFQGFRLLLLHLHHLLMTRRPEHFWPWRLVAATHRCDFPTNTNQGFYQHCHCSSMSSLRL